MTDSSSVIGSPTHLIFDCDGVLVDSEAIAIRVEEVRLAEAGFAVTAAEIAERFVGLSYASMAAQLETQFGQPLPCLLYTSPSPRDGLLSRMPSSA